LNKSISDTEPNKKLKIGNEITKLIEDAKTEVDFLPVELDLYTDIFKKSYKNAKNAKNGKSANNYKQRFRNILITNFKMNDEKIEEVFKNFNK
jgi:hypothetical protein